MKNLKVKMVVSMIVLLVVVLAISISTSAANVDNIKVVKLDADTYLIYIQDYEKESFKFAFSNNAADSNLKYRNNGTDTNGVFVAYIEGTKTSPMFMWAKDSTGTQILSAASLDFTDVIDITAIAKVASVTKVIDVNVVNIGVGDTNKYNEATDKNGIHLTAAGKLVIKDPGAYDYLYQLIPIDASAEQDYKDFFNLATAINKDNFGSAFEKLGALNEFMRLYNKLSEEAKAGAWVPTTSDYEIFQPEDKKYVVWIMNSEGTVMDAQFMFPGKYVDEGVNKLVERLPVTGEDNTLLIVFGVLIVGIIGMGITVMKLSNKTGKHYE